MYVDIYGVLFWRVDDGELKLYVNVLDVFVWGGSDVEEIMFVIFLELECVYVDLKDVGVDMFMVELYVVCLCRICLQGVCYLSGYDILIWWWVYELFNVCGFEWVIGFGNLKKLLVV